MEENKYREMFSEYITAGLTIGWSLYTMIFLLIIVLCHIPKENILNAGTAMGFIFGVVTGGTGVYFTISSTNKKTELNVEQNTSDINSELLKEKV